MSYKAIFFDWDGVITDSVNIKTEAFAALYHEYGEEIERKVVRYHLCHGGLSRFEKIKYFHNHYLHIDINEAELSMLSAKFSNIIFNSIVDSNLIPGALETLTKEALKGTMLFVVTGTPTEEIQKIAEAKNLLRFFIEIIGSPASKTNIIAHLMNKYALATTECLMIGDALEDYQAAINNDIAFMGIASTSNEFKVEFPQGTLVRKDVRI